MAHTIKIRKGRDIRLKGVADTKLDTSISASTYAIKPTDFHGLVPKLTVREGDRVKAGDTLFYDKSNELIKFSAPVSGTVKAIVRGEKRRVLAVEITPDSSVEYRDFGSVNPSQTTREQLMSHLLESGCWPSIVQRPFSIVARPENKPKAIFISGFDSAPLAADPDFVMEGQMDDFQKGIEALKVLADGKPIHLSHKKGTKAFTSVQGVTLHEVSGPHPAGNVGVQIHHVDPVNKGEVVWTIHPQDVANMGRFLQTGKFDPKRVVALAGSKVNSPRYFRVTQGVNIGSLTNGNIDATNNRIISGDVLTGDAVTAENYLGFYHTLVSVIPEGHEAKFFLTDGWLSPGFSKLSFSQAYPAWLIGKNKEYEVDTNNNGEHRAFVVTGQYERVFPFDIYPVQLIKAIMVNDIDQMEKLGIYEVAPEDFALCEFACTSKIDVQEVVRGGIDVLLAEFS